MVGKPPFICTHFPPPSTVKKTPNSVPTKEQIWVNVVLGNGIERSACGQIAGDRRPCFAGVGAFHQIWFEIAVLMIVKERVNRVRVVLRSEDAGDVAHVGNAGDLVYLAPVLAVVLSDLDQAVVGADIDQALFFRRFGKRRGVAVKRGRGVFSPPRQAPRSCP